MAKLETRNEHCAAADIAAAYDREIRNSPHAIRMNDAVRCPTCGKAFAPARVMTGHPTFDKKRHEFTTARRLYCDHCRQLIRWWEICDESGALAGALVDGTGYLDFVRDPQTIGIFLANHPQAICEEAA